MFEGTITNAPHIPRLRAFMDSRSMIRNPVEVFEQYRAELGPTFTFHFGGAKKAIVSSDPAFVEHVLRVNHANYHKSEIQVERMAEFQGQGLLNSHGAEWLRQRRLLAKGFQHGRLADLLPMQQEILDELIAEFAGEAEEGSVDVYQLMVRLTLKLVGKSLFGHQIEDEALEQIGTAISNIQGFIVRQIVQPYMIPWFRISGQSARFQQMRIDADQLIREHIQARVDGGGSDVLGMMLDTPYSDTGELMTDDQALVESLQLMVAGNETSSTALAWTFYLLAKHPEYIQQIRDEVDQVLGDGPADMHSLHKLEKTMCIVDEAMRLYPSFWMIDRVALEDDEVHGIRVPAGSTLSLYIYGLHRNTAVWEDPERFDPSRFEKKARGERPNFSHIPFGGGPRVCIGSNMAVMQILLVLVGIIRKYDFSLESQEDIGIRPMMILRPDGAIRMNFQSVNPAKAE